MIKPKLDAAHSVLSLKDYRELEQIKKPEDPHFISKRLGSGEQCYVAKDRHSICCYFWVAPGEREIEHEARILTIAGHQIYIHDCFTIEQCRGKSILPYFVEQICFKMKEQGYKEAVAVVYNDNYPSRKCFEKIGFQKGELIRHFVIPFTGKKYYTRRILKTK